MFCYSEQIFYKTSTHITFTQPAVDFSTKQNDTLKDISSLYKSKSIPVRRHWFSKGALLPARSALAWKK